MDPPVVTPGGAALYWDGQDGATYTISRSGVSLTPQPIPYRRPFIDSSPLFYTTSYRYTITAHFANGCGTSAVTVVPPKPYVPKVHAFPTGQLATPTYIEMPGYIPEPFNVDLYFVPPVNEEPQIFSRIFPRLLSTGFLVFGPGLPPDGARLDCGGPQGGGYNSVAVCIAFADYTLSARVGLGDWTWIVAPFWDTDHGLMVDANDGARIHMTFVRAK